MAKDKKNKHPFNTGDDFINLAKDRGADVKEKGLFTKVTTRAGSTFVKSGKTPLDKQTIANLKRWFRLLGLMILSFVCLGAGIIGILLATHQLYIAW